MIGDRKIFKPEHYVKKDIILPFIMSQYFCSKMIITISGSSGTGKTEISSLLQENLWSDHKIRCKIIHIDDYYYTSWRDRNKIRKKKGINSVGKQEIKWKWLNSVAKAFYSKSKFLYTQKIHRYTNSIEESKTDNNSIDILIVEGLYSGYLKYKDLQVYLKGTNKQTLNFRKERAKEVINKFRIKVLKKEDSDIIKLKTNSDLVVDW